MKDERDDRFICSVCGLPLAVGDWPCVKTIRPHGRSVQTTVFVPYFDFALGEQVDSLAQRKRFMRNKHLDYRDKLSKGDLSALADKKAERRKQQIAEGTFTPR